MYKFSLFFYFLVFFLSVNLNAIDYSNKKIESFFDCLLQSSPMGHTLFGNKPLSIFTIYKTKEKKTYQQLLPKIYIEEGLNSLAPESKEGNFIFFMHENQDSDTFLLFNRKETLKVIKENQTLFSALETPEQTLNSIINDPQRLFSKKDLLGILLGFGKNNSLQFSKSIESLHKDQNIRFVNIGENPCLITPILGPVFICFDEEETKPLEIYYKAVLKFLLFAKKHPCFHKLLVERITS